MGNCCGSQSALDDDPHTPTSRPYQPPPSVSRTHKPKVRSEGRTLGSIGGEPGQGIDPRTAAALAAEQRNQEIAKGGKLANQLAADRGKSRQQHLKDAAERQQEPSNLTWD